MLNVRVLRRARGAAVSLTVASLLALGTLAATPSGDPVEIPVLLPLTGVNAFQGLTQQQSILAVEDDVNKHGGIDGRPLKFVIQDDQTQPQLAVQLLAPTIAKGAPVLVGPGFASECNAVMPLIAKSGPVSWCFSPGIHPAPGSFIFATAPDTSTLLDVSFKYLARRGITRIATITSTDASGQDGDKSIDIAAAADNVTIVDREHFNVTDGSVTAQIVRIKAAGPQALVAWTSGTPFGTVLRGISDVGLDVPIVTTNGNINRTQMKQYASILPKELIFPGAPFLDPSHVSDKAVKAAILAFTAGIEARGLKVDWGHGMANDGPRMLVAALQKLGPDATAAQVRDYIGTMKFVGAFGRYDFHALPQRGVGNDAVVMIRWDPVTENWVALSRQGGAPL